MEQQVMTGLPKHFRTNSHVYNAADWSDQQMTAYLFRKDTAAQYHIALARAAMPPATSSRRHPIVCHQRVNATYPVLLVPPPAETGTHQLRGPPPA